MAVQMIDIARVFLFGLEFYHALAHIMIMTGMRSLPRKDLLRIRYYFLVDCLTVFASSFLLTGSLKWLATIQIFQHLFYFITWDKSYMAKKIIDWSCLDWYNKDSPRSRPVQLDSAFGTLFDVIVHFLMMYNIGLELHGTGLLVGVILACVALFAVVFNPKFAWSSPNSMPAWVQKRLGQLSLKYEE